MVPRCDSRKARLIENGHPSCYQPGFLPFTLPRERHPVNIDQASHAIGATVAYVAYCNLRIGIITEVSEVFVYVKFLARDDTFVVIPVLPRDLIFYYGPLMAQIIDNVFYKCWIGF